MRIVSGMVSGMLILAAALGLGCSTTQRPTAHVNRAQVTQQTSQGARVEVIVALENHTDKPLPIERTRYTLEVEGVPETFTFTDRTVATMPPGGVQTLTLPAAFATGNADLAGRPYRVSGTVVYEPPGQFRRLLSESRVPLPSVRFSTSGVLTADQR